MINCESAAQASLTTEVFHTQRSNLSNIPDYVTVQGTVVDVSKHKSALLSRLNEMESGCNIELLCLYMQQNWERFSPDVQAGCTGAGKTSKFVKSAEDTAFDFTNSNRSSDGNMILGGKLMTTKAITSAEFRTACQLISGKHPLKMAIQKVIKTSKSGNAVDFDPFESCLNLIDFPVTTIANLMRAIGVTYIKSNQFLSDGLLVGTTQGFVVAYGDGTAGMFKVMTLDTFRTNYDLKVYGNRVTKKQAEAYGFLEYSNGGQTHA